MQLKYCFFYHFENISVKIFKKYNAVFIENPKKPTCCNGKKEPLFLFNTKTLSSCMKFY
uniref:Uncharacterized protein n=1 Tax=uncultured Desulfobacterium sp. TaxID=201089 RepID=E1YGG8_9BACT|nr:unknown protein [uncultured Desulfobacterium sp.]